MRIKLIDGSIEELSEVQREEYVAVVLKDGLKGKDYLTIIGLRRGVCIVEETFQKEIDQLKDLYNTSKTGLDADRRSLQEMAGSVIELEKMLANAKSKVTGLEESIANHLENIEKADDMCTKKTGIGVLNWLP